VYVPDRLRRLASLALLSAFALVPHSAPTPPAVNAYLPWHPARVASDGTLEPWYGARARNLGYDHVLRLGWHFLERGVPVDWRAGVKVFLAYAVLDQQTRQGTYWQHNPASLYSSLTESLLPWYGYSGDRAAVRLVGQMLDYQLAHGTTPSGWAWPRVPFATSCGGDRTYGRCLAGSPASFYGGVEPDKVGALGLAYLHFYELTGRRRYAKAALACARALARHVEPGDSSHTPWPFRIDGRTGRTLGGATYGGLVVAPVQLLGELVQLHVGEARSFERARELAWRWLLREPLNPRSRASNRWSGYYEDIPYRPDDLNQAAPTLTAIYLLKRPRPSAHDPRLARRLLDWVRTSFGRGPFHGAWAIDEQHVPGTTGCCSPAGLGSDTARWAAAEALLAAKTGDRDAARAAEASLSYATYFARSNGLVSCCGGPGFRHPYWFSDGYGDYLGPFNRAMAALPELAPQGQDHLLESSSVVQRISYTHAAIRYRTFRRSATEVLRLSFTPVRVLVGGRSIQRRAKLRREGYLVRKLRGGDILLRVRHERSHVVSIER
jgi:hypothetical protein